MAAHSGSRTKTIRPGVRFYRRTGSICHTGFRATVGGTTATAGVSGPMPAPAPGGVLGGSVVMNWWVWLLIAIAAVLVISFIVALPDAEGTSAFVGCDPTEGRS